MKTYLVILRFTPLEEIGVHNFELENKQAYSVMELVKNLAIEFQGEKYEIMQITLIS